MNKGICLIFLFTFLSSCALLEKNRITEVSLNSENLLESDITDAISTFTFMRKQAPLDSVMIQIMFRESSPADFECRMIKGKVPYECEPLMRDKWIAKLQKNSRKNWIEMTAKAIVMCGNVKYRILASYSGFMPVVPGIEPH